MNKTVRGAMAGFVAGIIMASGVAYAAVNQQHAEPQEKTLVRTQPPVQPSEEASRPTGSDREPRIPAPSAKRDREHDGGRTKRTQTKRRSIEPEQRTLGAKVRSDERTGAANADRDTSESRDAHGHQGTIQVGVDEQHDRADNDSTSHEAPHHGEGGHE